MKLVIGLIVALGVIVGVGGAYYVKGEREQMRSEVAKSCIEAGGKYHETMFRRRPVCR